jgi:hypothetical protein
VPEKRNSTTAVPVINFIFRIVLDEASKIGKKTIVSNVLTDK